MSDMSDRLRSSYEYANSHMVFDLGVMLEAATHIERLEEQNQGMREWIRELKACADNQ
jgi:hypothetical protein